MSKATQAKRTLLDVAALITGADSTDTRDEQQRTLQLVGLEDRLLFSATPISPEMMEGEAPAEADEAPAAPAEGEQAQQQQNPDGVNDDFILQWSGEDSLTSDAESSIRMELVVVDTSTTDYQTLLDDLLSSDDEYRLFEVLLLDENLDGIQQISDALSNYSELDAIHLVTHSANGQLKLGNTWLDASGLEGYAGDIAGWRDVLADDADLVIYGCDLAASADGQLLIDSLAALTDSDVAASTDATGHASLGGDWQFEHSVGVIETDVAFSLQVQQDWLGLLAFESYADTFLGISYSNSDGTLDWDTSWQEIGESDGPTGGQIQIGNVIAEEVLQIEGDGRGISREVDLSSARLAFVEFSYMRKGMDLGDAVAFEVSTDGVVWNEVARFDGPADDGGFTNVSYSITPYIDSDTQIRFIATGMDDPNDHFYLNNVDVNIVPEISSKDEFLVNQEMTGDQETSGDDRGSQQAVSMAGDGSYVVVWSSQNQDASGWGVYARRFDSVGNALTDEILVNEIETGNEQWARVVSDSSGNFVVTWTSDHSGTSDVYARRFDSDGTALAGEFLVNTTTAGTQGDSKIAMDASGNFVIVWEGNGVGDADGIFYRRFDASGTAIDASDVRANVADEGLEQDAAVAMNDAGDFVVVWDVGGRIKFQMIDSSGTFGTADEVYNDTAGSSPAVAMDSTGNFVVAYRWNGMVGQGVWARKFDSAGVEVTTWFRVGPGTLLDNKDHDKPAVAMDDDGNFIVTYETIAEEGPGKDIVAERFDMAAMSLGRSVINQTLTGDQQLASVAMLDSDNYVVVFTRDDGDQNGVYARQFGTSSITGQEMPTVGILVSTSGDVASPSGAPGLDSWDEDEVLGFSDPNFSLGPAGTDGEFGLVFDLGAFGDNKNINGMHYVRSTLTVGSGGGATEFTLQEGDLLLTVNGASDYTYTGNTTSITIQESDLFVFRPQAPGDYTDGEFYFLLDNPLADNIRGVTLVESPLGVTIGDAPVLSQGTFLLSEAGSGDHDNIYTYFADTIGEGSTTSGTGKEILIDGENGDLNFTDQIQGIHLVESDMDLGGVSLQSGDLLLTLNQDQLNPTDGVGSSNLEVYQHDIFRLRMSETEQGANTQSLGVAEILFDGSNVGLDSDEEDLNALTLTVGSHSTNAPPSVSLTNVVSSLAEDADTSSSIKIADILITDDGSGTNSLALSGADAADFEIVGTELHLRAGTVLNFETKTSYDVTVEVDDTTVGGAPDDSVAHSLSITDSNEAPAVALTNVVPSLAEDTDTSSAIKIADIVITDDALGTNNLMLSGADAADFEIVGTELRLRAGTVLDFETQASFDVTVEVDDPGVTGTPDDTALHTLSITDANEAPTVALTNVVPTLAEDADTSSAIKIADIVITDDAIGTNNLSLAGADAADFEIVGTELRLRAGTVLDFETQASFDVTVEVDDPGVTGTPDDTALHTLSITDANEAPTVALTNVVPTLAEDADTSSAIKIADIVITDDAIGTNNLSLAGADAADFEIVGTELRLRAGTVLDFETQTSYDVTVEVDDPGLGGTPDDIALHTLSITDANEAPTVALTNIVPSLAEDMDTSSAIKIADIVITDDALGTNNLSLAGADAADFEIVGTELRLRAGTLLDFESKASFDVTVQVDDAGVAGSPDDTVAHSLAITNVNDAPSVGLTNVVASLSENTDTSSAIKIADIVITDDALGTNNLTLTGVDAGDFEIVGTELRLRAGTVLDFTTKSTYDVIVEVDDTSVAGTPDDSAAHTLSITDVNDPPTVALTNVVATLSENANTSSAIKIADIVITDDAVGTNNLTLAGVDAASFEIVGTELRLRAGTSLDYETKVNFDVTVRVDDPAVGGTPDDTVAHTLVITDANDVATVTLTNLVSSLAEDADTSGAIRVADIVVTDDGLGTNVLSLGGADASKFEIVAGQLRLRAGTALDFETDPSFSVVVRVDDASIGGSPDSVVAHTLNIANANDAPVAGDDTVVATQGAATQMSVASLLANDTDVDLDSLHVLAVSQPLHGTIVLTAEGTLVYTPDANFFGFDNFSYTVTDSSGATDTATVTVAVNAAAAPPVVEVEEVAETVVESEDESEESDGDANDDLMPHNYYQSNRDEPIRVLRNRTQTQGESLSVTEAKIAFIVAPRSATQAYVATNLFFNRTDVATGVADIHSAMQSQIHNLAYIYDHGGFLGDLDSSTDDIYFEYPIQQWVAGTAMFASAGLSVGYVMWTIRGGYLVASMLSSIPAWAWVDPLPVLEYLDDSDQSNGPDQDDESLDSIIDEATHLRSANQDQNVEVCAS